MPGFVLAAIWVMIVLLVLTPVFKNMPQSAQGAIIIVAVFGLINWREGVYLWKVCHHPAPDAVDPCSMTWNRICLHFPQALQLSSEQ